MKNIEEINNKYLKIIEDTNMYDSIEIEKMHSTIIEILNEIGLKDIANEYTKKLHYFD